MSLPSLQARRRNVRPVVDGLESRELLSAAPMVAAQVSMISGQEMSQESIVGQLKLPPAKTFNTNSLSGDQNPYGVAFVPKGFPSGGPLRPGDILVSNFNNSANSQGMGTTIVQINPKAPSSTTPAKVFFQGPSGLGLTTALGVLKAGFVIVGSVPTSDGLNVTPPGSLLILDQFGNQVLTLKNSKFLDGPWDLTVNDQGDHPQVFVSNVLNGTVTRLDLEITDTDHGPKVEVEKMTQIASDYAFRTDPMAVVLGPTGLAFDAEKNVLYVASTADNQIFAIPKASETGTRSGKGTLIYNDPTHLHGPLGLVLAPNGDLITANGDAVNTDLNHTSELVEFTPAGKFVSQFSIDPAVDAPFGIALRRSGDHLILATVNDNHNTLKLFKVKI